MVSLEASPPWIKQREVITFAFYLSDVLFSVSNRAGLVLRWVGVLRLGCTERLDGI